MPTYAYECTNCGYQFERVQKFTDDPISKCPNCKKNKVRRVIQANPVVFKGSGWYITDHRSNSKKTASSTSSNGDKADKSEKPAEKAETTSASAEKSDSPTPKAESKPAKSESKSKSSSD